MVHQPPTLDAPTARTILDTLDELGVGLSARQIRMKQAAKAALAYWREQSMTTPDMAWKDELAIYGGRP